MQQQKVFNQGVMQLDLNPELFGLEAILQHSHGCANLDKISTCLRGLDGGQSWLVRSMNQSFSIRDHSAFVQVTVHPKLHYTLYLFLLIQLLRIIWGILGFIKGRSSDHIVAPLSTEKYQWSTQDPFSSLKHIVCFLIFIRNPILNVSILVCS